MKSERKLACLRKALQSMESALVAFSGGTDSTLLLKLAADTLGRENVLAVTAVSPVMTRQEQKDIRSLAKLLGVKLLTIQGSEMENPRFLKNDARRCYWCKRDRFRELKRIARTRGLRHVIDGSNTDDLGDYRPGMQAVRELGIRSPLLEAGLSKHDIRQLSRGYGLPTWDKPAAACLASRIPYGTPINEALLRRLESAERHLLDAGFSQVRLRHHGTMARIEVTAPELTRFMDPALRGRIVKAIKKLGWNHISLDLAGYTQGSMNTEIIKK